MPVCSICKTHNESTIAGRVFFLLIANQVSIVSNKVSELDIVVDLITKYHKKTLVLPSNSACAKQANVLM